MWKGSRAGHGRGRPRATLAQWHGTWWLTGMGWSGVGLGHSDTALTAAFTCRLQLPSGPAQCGPAQCGLPRGPAERLERLVTDCESASAAGERAARTLRTGPRSRLRRGGASMGTVWEREQCGEAAWRERQWNVDATHRVRCRGDGRRSVRQCDWADAAVQRGCGPPSLPS